MDKNKKKMYLLGVVSVILLLSVIIIMGVDRGESVSDLLEEVVSSEADLDTSSNYKIDSYNTLSKKVTVLILQTKEEEYRLVKDMKDGITRVYKDDVEIGTSDYEATNSESAQFINLEPIGETFDSSGLEYKQIADGLVYQISNSQTREYLQNFYDDGYELDTQIATSIYNEIYLKNEAEKSYYRIIVVNNLDLMLVSELDDLSMLDRQNILQIRETLGD